MATNKCQNIDCIIASDSRARDFPLWQEQSRHNSHLYRTHFVICRGGNIDRILNKTLELLKSIENTDLILVLLMGGICEITIREHHTHGTELAVRKAIHIEKNILKFKELVRAIVPNCLVSIATIPIVDFAKAKQHYYKVGKLSQSEYSEEETLQQQKTLSEKLASINHFITEQNKKLQLIPKFGITNPCQRYLHQAIEKTTTKRRGASKISVKRIPQTALVDGVHGSEHICRNWFNIVHECFVKDIGYIFKASNNY
jgi:hypothetical protein